ncbi:MAG: proline dehydrogenase [Flavobacteriales bacterium CG_4_9_14_0_2_um_filter_35_242]|nr:proline dehydrogenase [Zetaproteobacteria bacterium]OIO10729.1 MAG: proline dehydrogenase [Flavobacteriaceae bacterium CG1_02_35_72]PIR12723.1 MAG: proline dehydrogenase [Flavobacteriales bacterium CG11_big_fil_rev_8_21_14_0_20_35_7]PIV16844.1 MAG: proline dehydrogenase [Flavobacteriales bacterium CG03_land_8_20_14_0_80_35_15]PIX07906.1 MAG: proline dehydrogenase [Flavobacteriales bacterium CG_4_8_14_3_um_filter_35_10]PJA06913.1 MAG: proline dehydrogenase [Flavobacteriales bacterium CG_4_10
MTNPFDNTENAFALKSDSELERAYFLFKMIKSEPLVKIGTAATNFALKAHLPVEGLIRSTVFDHFCGGVTEEDCMDTIKKMYSEQVHAVLDYSVEGAEEESQFDLAMNKTLKNIDFAKENISIPFAVFKPTGFGRLALYQKITERIELSDVEQLEWDKVKTRYNTVCKYAYDNGVHILIDAEESWMQEAADNLIEEMMAKYNKDKAIVFGTLQLYRWDRLDYLKNLHQRAKAQGFHVGMKLVRGAYMEKERERAAEKGYKSPICDSKAATDANYNAVVIYILEHLEDMAIFEGTHNEQSSELLMELIDKYHLNKNDNRIWFGQLYGMSDHISYNLSKNGYNVAKYLPYGPVRDVMPYLIRRAEENTSVAGQTNRELELLKKERKRRKI